MKIASMCDKSTTLYCVPGKAWLSVADRNEKKRDRLDKRISQSLLQ